MDRTHWFFHPLLVFVFSILALGTSLFLYIYWYIEVSAGLKSLVTRFNLDSGQVFASQTWVVILVLSILVGIILLGIFTIFVYNQKILQLYRLQRNFISNFTHELKTPAASLNLYLETFQKYELKREEQLKYIGYMLSDVKRLSDNIMRILNLAKIESKSHVKEFENLNLVDTVVRFLEKNGTLFQNSQIRIDNPSNRAFFYPINASLFEILLTNLLTNAITYNTSAKPQIDVRFKPLNDRLDIEFEDNGIGFEKRERKKIFKKFYQIGRSDDMSAKGTGLGLYLVYNIARIHRAKVTAESHGPGKGSVFTLSLPDAGVRS
jgi:signal transduction histidine kinase